MLSIKFLISCLLFIGIVKFSFGDDFVLGDDVAITTTGAAEMTTSEGNDCEDLNVTECRKTVYECNNPIYKPIVSSKSVTKYSFKYFRCVVYAKKHVISALKMALTPVLVSFQLLCPQLLQLLDIVSTLTKIVLLKLMNAPILSIQC